MKARPYQMTARAAAAERTAERLVDAMLARFSDQPYDQVRLDDVAADAGVTVQTLVRRFGSKAGLMQAVVERELGRIMASRAQAATARPVAVLADLVAHYEVYGALILKVYAEAPQVEGLVPLVAAGREYHLGWCRDAFEKHLSTAGGVVGKARRLAQVTAVCDATTWRILRLDLALDVEQTRLAVTELVEPLLRPASRG